VAAHALRHYRTRTVSPTEHVPRVTVVGADGSSATVLAHALADHYGTVCVPEYTRMYLMDKAAVGADSWWPEEFTHIARTQSRIAEEAERGASTVLICDTDAFSVWVWHQAHVRHPLHVVREIAQKHPADLYVLVSGSSPTRIPHDSAVLLQSRLQEMYRTELSHLGLAFVEVSGPVDEQLRTALGAIEPLLG